MPLRLAAPVNRWLMLGVLLAAVAALAITVWPRGDGADSSPADGAASAPPRTGSGVNAAPGLHLRPGRITGFVRDVNGRPVPGARVVLEDRRRSVSAKRSGRYAIRARPGRYTLTASRPGYTRQSVVTTVRRGRGQRVEFALAVTAADRVDVPNSADRLILWTSCDKLAGLREPELRRWIARGVDGFVCQTRQLWGLGGTQRFTSRAATRLRGSDSRLQRALMASPAVRRAREGQLVLYLAFYAVNYFNQRTPFVDWFDDHGWSSKVLPRVRDLANSARSMGFAGLAIDQELYPQKGGVTTASWSVHYPGNRHSEAEVRSKVRQRGRELMKSILSGYPGVELVAYETLLPESWYDKVEADINQKPDVFRDDVRVDLWDGLSSVEGYAAFRWMDALFYKTFQFPGASWDTALQYNANRLYSYLSRRFSNWAYASSRIHISPFSWIDAGNTPFEQARSPEHVSEQLDAFRRWGTGGSFADYAYQGLGDAFDYAPYEDAMRKASTPARVDRQPPSLALTSQPPTTRRVPAGQTISLQGTAGDDYGIRAVRWYDDRGRQGVARLNWTFTGDMRSGWKGVTRWSVDRLRVRPDAGHITISAEDIHGLARQLRLTVER
jgi:hypothetical protein